MLEINLYNNNIELFSQLETLNYEIITPGPIVADSIRNFSNFNFNITTISKWASDKLKLEEKERTNKATLFLRLASIWRIYFPEEETSIFFEAFELFTEIRSYTLDLNLLNEMLTEIEENIKKSVMIFWAFLESEKLIDEHLSYQLISNSGLINNKKIIFLGFKHFSGIQVDMLKKLGETNEIILFFPKKVYENSISTDWIKWLLPVGIESKKNQSENEVEKLIINVLNFKKENLKDLLNLKKSDSNCDILLVSNSIKIENMQEVISDSIFFKHKIDLFDNNREKIFKNWQNEFKNKILTIEEFLLVVDKYIKSNIELENYIGVKVCQIVKSAVDIYKDFQSKIDHFAINVIKHVTALNSPRNFLISIAEGENIDRLIGIDELLFLKIRKKVNVIASVNLGNIKLKENLVNERIIKILTSLAPIKRKGLDFEFLKYELLNLFKNEFDNVLYLEDGLVERSLDWQEILHNIELKYLNDTKLFPNKQIKDVLSDYIINLNKKKEIPVTFSPSYIQSYRDCPRKFYFTYLENLEHRPIQRLELAPDELGVIEHKIIENYFLENNFKEFSELNTKAHELKVRMILMEFIAKKNVPVSDLNFESIYFEVVLNTKNGIEYILDYLKQNNAVDIKFEIELVKNSYNLKGRMDCVVYFNDKDISLFDFKRSSHATGTKKSILRFDKIQLWLYILYLKDFEYNIKDWGNICLSEIDKSNFFNEFDQIQITNEAIECVKEIYTNTLDKIQNDKIFKANPVNNSICNYCDIKMHCEKGTLSNE